MAGNELHDLTAAYALHALDPVEEAAYEAHLRECAACRTELAGLQDATASLAYLHAAPAPPRELRGRILERARSERAAVVPLRRRRPFQATALAAAASLVAAIGLGAWALSLSSELDREREAGGTDDRALALAADPAAERIALEGGQGTLVVAGDGRAALLLPALPPPPEGRVYEAWVGEDAGSMRPAGTFGADGGTVAFLLSLPVDAGALVAVTLEDAPGAESPTGNPLFSAQTT